MEDVEEHFQTQGSEERFHVPDVEEQFHIEVFEERVPSVEEWFQSVIERLKATEPKIEEICKITGTPGLSLGVLHDGEIIYRHNFGLRDVEENLPTTSDTIYHLGSLSKQFTASLAGNLVSDGTVGFDSPIHIKVPRVRTSKQPHMRDQITLRDLLSHGHGLAAKENMWYQSCNRPLLPKVEALNMFKHLEVIRERGIEGIFSNFGYAMAGQLLETATQETWGSLVKQKILKHLKLGRTFVDEEGRDDTDYAAAYMALDNAGFKRIERPFIQDGTLMDAALGVRSTVNDLLTFYKSILLAWKEGSPLERILEITSAYIPVTRGSQNEHYGLGWVRTNTPGPLCTTSYDLDVVNLSNLMKMSKSKNISEWFNTSKSTNVPELMDTSKLVNLPDVCRTSPTRLTLYHHGNLPGYTSSVYMFPETQSAIVVLTNSLGIANCANWTGQLLIETLFDEKCPHDFVEWARKSTKLHINIYHEVQKKFIMKRSQAPGSPRSSSAYVGKYYNRAKNWHISIGLSGKQDRRCEETLMLTFQSHDDDRYALLWYEHDTFIWHVERDNCVKRGRMALTNIPYEVMRFGADEYGKIVSLTWCHDASVPGGETFRKDEGELTLDSSFESRISDDGDNDDNEDDFDGSGVGSGVSSFQVS